MSPEGERGEHRRGIARHELEPLIPALQSTSLFGNASGVEVVDAQNILAGEAATIADLLATLDPDGTVAAVVVSAGAVPAALAKVVRASGQSVTIKKMRERTPPAGSSMPPPSRGSRSRRRRRRRWSSDSAPMSPRCKALDQLVSSGTGSPAKRCSTVSATGRTSRCGTTRMP